MSIKASTYVWENSEQKGTALLLMLAIADIANEEGVAWPGVTRLAHKARTTRRNIQLLLRKLEEADELEVCHGTGRYRTNVYALKNYRDSLTEKGEDITPLEAWFSGKGEIQRRKGEIQRQERANPTTPNTSLEPLVEPSEENAREEEGKIHYLDNTTQETVQTLMGIGNWDKNEAQTIDLVADTKKTYPRIDLLTLATDLAFKLRTAAVTKYKKPSKAFANWASFSANGGSTTNRYSADPPSPQIRSRKVTEVPAVVLEGDRQMKERIQANIKALMEED